MTTSPFKNNEFIRVLLTVLAICSVGGLFSGCGDTAQQDIDDLRSSSVASRSQDLGQTMKYIDSYERFEMGEFRNKVNSGLNRWMSTRTDTQDSWAIADSASSLPESIKSHSIFTNLASDKFSGNDAFFVQQCYWMEKVAERVHAKYTILNHEYALQIALSKASDEEKEAWKTSDDLLALVVAKLNPALNSQDDASGMSEVKLLARAMELFDWTVRNIQLTEARAWPSESTMDKLSLTTDVDPKSWPPATGAIGPGYSRYPWQTVTYGKGDFIDRAHVFALLCQASGIPVTILATPAVDGSIRPYEEWLPAVMVGKELYLFDTLLGIPIPGDSAGSIATLDQVKAEPTLLSRLNLTPQESVEKQDYRVVANQLDGVLALIAAEPESISRRMFDVQGALTGAARVGLVSNPDVLIEEIRSLGSVKQVVLWHMPFSIALFREQVALAVDKTQFDADMREKLLWLPTDEIYIDNFVMFRTARNMYLRGIFEADRNSRIRSALSYYFAFMYSDEDISNIKTDPQLQESLGIRQAVGQDARNWMEQLAYMEGNMTLIRADAAFFMSLAHFENGNPQPALNWLDNQLPKMDTDGRWEPWRQYQRGRAFESAGDYVSAQEAFDADSSAQKAGSKLRSRWMKELEALKNGS